MPANEEIGELSHSKQGNKFANAAQLNIVKKKHSKPNFM